MIVGNMCKKNHHSALAPRPQRLLVTTTEDKMVCEVELQSDAAQLLL